MDNETKEALLRARPWAPSAEDAQRLSASPDTALPKIIEEQQRFNARVHDELASIPLPGNLRDQILGRRKVIQVSVWRKAAPVLAIAAALVLLAGGLFFWISPGEDLSVAGFRSRMVRFANKEYRMDLFTKDISEIKRYLASKGDPTQFSLPQKVAMLPVKGGASLTWQAKPVSMICFDWGANDTLYMFVLGEPIAPSATAQLKALKKLNTATWTADGKTFVLVGRLSEQSLADLVRS